jgi:hypothetical protein
VRAVRRTERRGLRSLRAACDGGTGGGAAAAPAEALRTVAYAAADGGGSGGGASAQATGRAETPGEGGVLDEFRSGPGALPGATLSPPSPGGGDGGPPVLALIAVAFLTGFALVWAIERRRPAA